MLQFIHKNIVYVFFPTEQFGPKWKLSYTQEFISRKNPYNDKGGCLQIYFAD